MSGRFYDYVIVGSGIAGLYAALMAREHGSVLILTKDSVDECNTRYAQGGIAAAVDPSDSPAIHMQDTVAAGAGVVDSEAVRVLTEEAADRINDLVGLGVSFDTVEGKIALANEGAHSRARVIHAGGDATGAVIETTLLRVIQLSAITLLEHHLVTDILVDGGKVAGVEVLDTVRSQMRSYGCRALIMATGGAGCLYQVTTNPSVATGDGIALAYRAGAEVMDLEFFQFHPTVLHLPGVPPFLISEAVRGEGALLLNATGVRFMPKYHPQAELAPRDAVSRAIVCEMAKTRSNFVLLDATGIQARMTISRFPSIYRFCLGRGLDITKDPVPVSPAAHYTMGGIRTNVWGETTLSGLYACGEAACTGVHGANRLGSNSLIETVVFARRVIARTISLPGASAAVSSEAIKLPAHTSTEVGPLSLDGLQALMWESVGIVREGTSLACARELLYGWQAMLSPAKDRLTHELTNLLVCGRLATEAAWLRKESRGSHYRSDFPKQREEWRRHMIFRRLELP